MLKDITIGQHFPGNSVIHRMDPRAKLLLTIAYIVVLFIGSNPIGLALSALFLVIAYRVSGIPLRMVGKSLRPILPIILFTSILNLFFVGGLERIVAIFLHIALSVLVWRAVRDKKAGWYWAAFGGHFAVDFAAVLLAGYSIIATEILVALMTAAIVWYAARAYKEAEAE